MKKEERLYKELNELDEVYLEEVYQVMNKKKTPNLKGKSSILKKIGMVAAACFLIVAIPNASPALANTLANIPVLGEFFQVITINRINEVKEGSIITVETPKIINSNQNDSVEEVNASIEEYTQRMIELFNKDIGGMKSALSIDYKIITDTNDWFTLQISSIEVRASGNSKVHYYNIDKKTGEYMKLSDYITDFDAIKEEINKNIVEQMENEMKKDEGMMYFIDGKDQWGFKSITEDQQYYFNDQGELIISFNEYDVAPGVMGIVEFKIPAQVYN